MPVKHLSNQEIKGQNLLNFSGTLRVSKGLRWLLLLLLALKSVVLHQLYLSNNRKKPKIPVILLLTMPFR